MPAFGPNRLRPLIPDQIPADPRYQEWNRVPWLSPAYQVAYGAGNRNNLVERGLRDDVEYGLLFEAEDTRVYALKRDTLMDGRMPYNMLNQLQLHRKGPENPIAETHFGVFRPMPDLEFYNLLRKTIAYGRRTEITESGIRDYRLTNAVTTGILRVTRGWDTRLQTTYDSVVRTRSDINANVRGQTVYDEIAVAFFPDTSRR